MLIPDSGSRIRDDWPERPGSAAEIAEWLRAYRDWREDVGNVGAYAVPVEGTRIQSNRTGRPTENAALMHQATLARMREVDCWLRRLSSLERQLAECYLAAARLPARIVAERNGLSRQQAQTLIQLLPLLIWTRHYNDE